MRKSFFTLAPMALLMAFAGSVQAADNAMITITGNVQATTCDVRTSHSLLDLKTHKASAFTTAKAPVAASTESFTLTLENCEDPSAAGIASLRVKGPTLSGYDDIFGDKSTLGYGVVLNESGKTDLIKNDTLLKMKDVSGTDKGADIDNTTLVLQASLAAPDVTSGKVKNGQLAAPIVFQFDYN